MSESLKTKELEAELHSYKEELHSYKEAVHMLSFQLEMMRDRQGSSVVPHRSVVNIRKHALKQAAEFVMDWGDRKSTRLNSSHVSEARMPSSA